MVSCCAKLYYYHRYYSLSITQLMINLVKILSNGSIKFNCTVYMDINNMILLNKSYSIPEEIQLYVYFLYLKNE